MPEEENQPTDGQHPECFLSPIWAPSLPRLHCHGPTTDYEGAGGDRKQEDTLYILESFVKSKILLPGSDPWVRKIPWRKKWQPSKVFYPGEFHRQKSLMGYSPWGHKESETTER